MKPRTFHLTLILSYLFLFQASKKGKKKKANNDLKYDILGWVVLAVGVIAWVGFAKSHMPPPPPSPM